MFDFFMKLYIYTSCYYFSISMVYIGIRLFCGILFPSDSDDLQNDVR